MIQEIINDVTPILTTAIVAVLSIVIKKVGDATIDYISSKKEYVEINTTKQQRDNIKTIAKDIWNVVEEEFRMSTKVSEFAETKIDMFNRLLLKKIPGLTQSQIDTVRQAIAGEFNKGKQVIITDTILTDTNLKLQQENTSLETENIKLKEQLEQVNKLINPEQV